MVEFSIAMSDYRRVNEDAVGYTPTEVKKLMFFNHGICNSGLLEVQHIISKTMGWFPLLYITEGWVGSMGHDSEIRRKLWGMNQTYQSVFV